VQRLDVHDDNARFFQDLAQAKRRVLVLDYDNVIAPGGGARHRGIPCPTVPELLDCIMTTGRTRVVLITGSQRAGLAPLAPGPAPDVWGTAGSAGPDVMLPAMLASLGDDTAVAYLSDRDRPLNALPPTASEQRGDPASDAADCRQAFVQFLVDWLRVCGGEFC
jgi:hypothetical protein